MSSSSNSTKGSEDLFGNSSLDHALLESLFYTEMMHMNDADSSVLSNQLLSSLTADGALVESQPEDQQQQEVDPNIAVEKDLLNHFGVNDVQQQQAAEAKVPATNHTPNEGNKSARPRFQLASPERQVSSLTASLVPDLVAKPKAPPTPAVAPFPPVASSAAAATNHVSGPIQMTATKPSQNHAAADAPANPPVPTVAIASTTTTSAAASAEEEKRSKLVHQFATLASRLGITLPNNVLQSLTHVAGNRAAPAPYVAPPPPVAPPPTVQQLATTAEEAIAAVGRKRARSESPPQANTAAAAAAAAAAASSAAAAKRRKKPRLVECEHKLAELKAENAMLKRHLANVSAQSHQLDQDRQAQEQRMRQMAAAGSTEEELNQAIQTFQDMYSDYGRRRHSEITFHLDQLLRLANPTNFTKMGLWTMGQQSKNNRNPIASILQKELGITSQQGKKILEQREKIRRVCDNMKETLRLLTQLKALCEQKTKIFHDRMTKCREILKPSQVVKCLVWIDQNSETLAKLCPGWGSEQMVAGSGSAK